MAEDKPGGINFESCIDKRISRPLAAQVQVAALGRDASATATSLAGYKAEFSESVGHVTATIGGSAQRVDQDMDG